MKALILCGGHGTRVRAVIGATQKAIAEVDGRPFLTYVVEQLARAGLRDLVFCAHYQSQQVEEVIAFLPEDAMRSVRLVREPEPLGTGGAVLYALHETAYRGPLIVVNADTFLDELAYRLASEAPAPAMLSTHVSDRSRFGAVSSDQAGQVTALAEKGLAGPGWINAGVYRFDGADLARFEVRSCSLEGEILPNYLERGALRTVRYEGPFIDIGTPESLFRIRQSGVRELYNRDQ